MGRGLGDTQRAALTLIHEAFENGETLTMPGLAEALGVSDRRARMVAASLEARGLAFRNGFLHLRPGRPLTAAEVSQLLSGRPSP